MSILYDKRTKSAIKWVWGIIVVLITLSMIVVYSGLTSLFSQQPAAAQAAPQQTTNTNVNAAPVTASTSAPVTITPVTTPVATTTTQ